MRIGNALPPLNQQNPAPIHYPAQPEAHDLPKPGQVPNKGAPGAVVDISPKAWAAYTQGKDRPSGFQGVATALSDQECKTCKNRRYQDGSNDPSVSLQTPTHIDPGQSAAVVSSHESEHVSNEQMNAERDGREIVSQTVTLSTSICPECKRVYISGGTTRTIIRGKDNLPLYA